MYSNSCCSCSFEAEIIKIGQSSHKMYSNNILNLQESMTILNPCTKKVWKLIEWPTYVVLFRPHQYENVELRSVLYTKWVNFQISFCRALNQNLKGIWTWILLKQAIKKNAYYIRTAFVLHSVILGTKSTSERNNGHFLARYKSHWRYNCLQIIRIINYLKPYNCLKKYIEKRH